MDEEPRPRLRRPLGILMLIAMLTIYALVAVALAGPVARLHPLVQLPVWIVLGLAWVLPARPLLVWMETGRWRVPRQ